MAYFPVFMDLDDKPVLVVGGGQVAARKVRALLKTGARISVIAAGLGDELGARSADGDIRWIASGFEPHMIEGFWLAFAATDDAVLNQAVFEAGEARGVAVNVVDDGRHSRFISPAVIDRHPVQVAVSTGGASPILARAIRSWIEDVLPHGLGKIATAAGELRKRIGRKLSPRERRRNWEFLIDRARIVHWSSHPVEAISRFMRQEFAGRARRVARGKVFLVGAGPGRPELLTVRAIEVLQQADLILHDRLVPEAILDQARRDAERIDVGKRAGDHHGVQARIFDLMVEGARAGKTVVRLKGGDAFVFGRGGEELQHLRANEIEFEVVPGITAALGCAAYAGIPLTHREHAHRLTFVTGHLSGRDPGWPGAYADGNRESSLPEHRAGETLVIYMGVRKASAVHRRLIDQGVSPSTPAALIVDGTTDRQQVIYGTVFSLAAMAARVPDGAPGLFIVGEVAAMGQQLAWFAATPRAEEIKAA